MSAINLKYIKKEVIFVNTFDLNHLINTTYDTYYYTFSAEDKNNDDILFIANITGKLKEYEKERIKEFIKIKNGIYMTRILLEDLCMKGLIEKGDYLISNATYS